MSSSRFSGNGFGSSSGPPKKKTFPKKGSGAPKGFSEATLSSAGPAGKSSGTSSVTSRWIVRSSPAALQCGSSTTETVRSSPGVMPSSGTITSCSSANIICGLSWMEIDTSANVACPALFESVSVKASTIRSTFSNTSKNGTGDVLRKDSV